MEVTKIIYTDPNSGEQIEKQFNTTVPSMLGSFWWKYCIENNIITVEEIEDTEDEDYLSDKEFQYLLKKFKMYTFGYTIKECIACIYDLWQDFILSDEQEYALYKYIDPEDRYNDIEEYYYQFNRTNPLRKILEHYKKVYKNK